MRITLPGAVILFFMIVWQFEAVLHSGVKLCQLEAVIYAVPEVALFLLYVHLTIGYRKYAAIFSWGLIVALIAVWFGNIIGKHLIDR